MVGSRGLITPSWDGRATPSSWRSRTIDSAYEHAYDCDVECIEYAEALAEAETLITHLDQLSGEAPDSKHRARTFEPTEDVKLVPIDPTCSNDRALRISATLDSK